MRAQLVNHIADLPADPAVVTIDGFSGAGKTVLGTALQALLPTRPALLEVEMWAHGWEDLAGAVQRVRAVVEGLRHGPVRTRMWDWSAGRLDGPQTIAPSPVILVVGCGAGQIDSDLSIWIDVPEDVRLRRVTARDSYDWSEHWETWAAQERALLEQCDARRSADWLLTADDVASLLPHPLAADIPEGPAAGTD